MPRHQMQLSAKRERRNGSNSDKRSVVLFVLHTSRQSKFGDPSFRCMDGAGGNFLLFLGGGSTVKLFVGVEV